MIQRLYLLSLLFLWLACSIHLGVLGCSECTDVETNGFVCNGQMVNLCNTDHSKSWKVAVITQENMDLYSCDGLEAGDKLLLFVSKGKLINYGKYEVVTAQDVTPVPGDNTSQCRAVFDKPITMDLEKDHLTCLIAQRLPSFDKVSLLNKCVLTCGGQKDGLGGILAFEADSLVIDSTSKIDMTGKGFIGGAGGDSRGGGGYGGETFDCPANALLGKGGDISNVPWAKNTDGIGGGGAGDGPQTIVGSKGGPGGTNAGGGGGDSTVNSDDGAAGGGGGGHFSGGGGGGGGSGCGGHDGGKGGSAGKIGTHAGGGGQSSCPGGHGGNGGSAGKWPPNQAPHCYDKSASGGNAGSSSSGGGGGDSCGNAYGGGGGGGGVQFGNTNFTTHLSYGGGGGGGGASAFRDDPNTGGKGGSGGGLVYLQLGKLELHGTIHAKGNSGQCLNRKGHRSAPGGSGAGGSVVIFTKKLVGDPNRKISVSGGAPVKCAFGTGGGGGGGIGRWVVQEGRATHQS